VPENIGDFNIFCNKKAHRMPGYLWGMAEDQASLSDAGKDLFSDPLP
jgi:hypothetical protein